MIRRLDQFASVAVSLIGLAHLAVGREAFSSPTAGGVWFVSAGFLLVTTGLANLACAGVRPARLQSAAAGSGAVAILISGALIAAADRDLLFAPQSVVLIVLGLFLSFRRLSELFARGPNERG